MDRELNIVKLDSVESTNKYCEALPLDEVEDFTCYWALEQTAGIGQRGNHWHSTPGLNLTFSLVLKPTWLLAERQFRLTQALSLAIVDLLTTGHRPLLASHSSLHTTIKWPNDIYVGMSTTTAGNERQHYGKKICGTLVSTRLTTNATTQSSNQAILSSAVCGIGLNVNETAFPSWVPNPTSLSLLTGQHYELEPLLHDLLHHIERRYTALRNGADLNDEYLALLLNRNVPAEYIYHDRRITATIDSVDPFGRLLLTAADGTPLRCTLKEIALLQQ